MCCNSSSSSQERGPKSEKGDDCRPDGAGRPTCAIGNEDTHLPRRPCYYSDTSSKVRTTRRSSACSRRRWWAATAFRRSRRTSASESTRTRSTRCSCGHAAARARRVVPRLDEHAGGGQHAVRERRCGVCAGGGQWRQAVRDVPVPHDRRPAAVARHADCQHQRQVRSRPTHSHCGARVRAVRGGYV